MIGAAMSRFGTAHERWQLPSQPDWSETEALNEEIIQIKSKNTVSIFYDTITIPECQIPQESTKKVQKISKNRRDLEKIPVSFRTEMTSFESSELIAVQFDENFETSKEILIDNDRESTIEIEKFGENEIEIIDELSDIEVISPPE